MENIGYIGLSQQMALKQQMDIVANNIANANTTGYKSQNVLFTDYVSKPKNGDPISQSVNFKTYRDLTAGSMSQTFNPLDVAIQGDGYFMVQLENGETAYTRDGSFMLDGTRQLVTKDGRLVLTDGGSAITVPPEARRITVTPTGDITTEQGIVGRLGVSKFNDEQALERLGDNLYGAGGQIPITVDDRKVVQGAIETSNVNPVLEMTKMTEILRLFQSTQNMQQNDHDRQRKMIQSLTRVT